MSLITEQKLFSGSNKNTKFAFVIAPFTGKVWHHKRLANLLNRKGYDVLVISYGTEVLQSGDPLILPKLISEAKQLAETTAAKYKSDHIIIGSSLGSLIALNILRSSKSYDKAVLITGGDVAKVAKKFYPNSWRISYAELANQWDKVNMYTQLDDFKNKHAIMVLAKNDRVVDPADIIKEAKRHQNAGNDFRYYIKPGLRHGRRVAFETIIFPGRIYRYIKILG